MVRLPVSGALFVLRPPAGEEDVLLLESGDDSTGVAIALLQRLALPASGACADIGALVLTDFQALLLRLHQAVSGGEIEAAATCARPACRAPIAVSFDLESFLARHSPRTPSGIAPEAPPGWWALAGDEARYRLPTAADLSAARRETDPEAALRQRCLDPADMPALLRRRAERAMAAQAPDLSRTLRAICPECGVEFDVLFDVEDFVLRTLRAHAVFIYQDAHLLALHYHWSEATILSMPRARRIRYAEMLHGTV